MLGWHHLLNGHDMSKFQELVMDREAWQAAWGQLRLEKARV